MSYLIDGKEFYQLRDERVIEDEVLSAKMFTISRVRPEKPDANSSGYEWSEMGMANLFGEVYAEEVRYCPEHKAWYIFHGGAWRRDSGAILVSEKIKEFVRLMGIYCNEIEDAELRKNYSRFVKSLEDRRMRDRVLKDATGELCIHAAAFDAKPHLINCLDGTFDLNTLVFYEAKWDDFLTMQTRFEGARFGRSKCEIWEKFISEVTQDDEDKADFLQRALGYSMLGTSNEECMFILHGKTTRNGKSTLLRAIEYLLGDYSTTAPVGMICRGDRRKDAEAPSPMLAGLKGKRFVTMAESNAYGKLDEEQIKQLTGGEEISARALFESPVTFLPQFTLWLSCNDLPMVTDASLFASNRIKVIEFNRHFSPEEQDVHLKYKLTQPEAMEGIFEWLVNGYIKYQLHGLTMADSLVKVIKKYEEDNDVVLRFLNARCERKTDGRIRMRDLFKAYQRWARAEQEVLLSNKQFKAEMDRHSYAYERKGVLDGYPTIYGLALKESL